MIPILLLAVIPMTAVAWWFPRLCWTCRYPGLVSVGLMTAITWPLAMIVSLLSVQIGHALAPNVVGGYDPEFLRVFVHDGTDTDWEYVGWRFFSVGFPLGVALASSVRYATHLSHGGETAGLRLLRRIGCFVGRLTRVFARKAVGV